MRNLTPFIDEMLEAYERRSAFRPAAGVPQSVDDAYAVHSALMDVVGPVGGYKITQRPDQTPFVAPFPASRVHPSGAVVERPTEIGLELEVGFHVIEEPPSLAEPDFRERLLACVRPAPMIEIIASRIEGDLADDPYVKLADFQACEAVVFGDPLMDWTGGDLTTPDMEFLSDYGPIYVGPGNVPGGSVCDALVATARTLDSRFGGLKAGQKVLTGALVKPSFTQEHMGIVGRLQELGEVAARV